MTARSIFAAATLAAILAAPHARANSPIPNAPAPPVSHPNDVSLDGYRQHLQALSALVEACAKARDKQACDTALVGQDDRVPLTGASNAERRLVCYDWLRALLLSAQDKDKAPAKSKLLPLAKGVQSDESTLPPPPTTTELLQAAKTRLTSDLAQAGAAPAALPAHAAERETMKKVLAGRDFRNLGEPSASDTALEKLGNWLNKFFEGAANLGAHAAWIGRLLVWGFILAVCVGLAWALIQIERRSRLRLLPDSDGPAPGAPSAREWQLWLEDARKAAAAGLWREAVHFVYWAAISRLESRRLWPADRARTPREYLALVAPEDPRKPGLATLTGSFERIWYGGRPAAESDYRTAELLAAALISGSAATGGGAR